MPKSTLDILAKKMFEGRRNVLLSNISFKYRSNPDFDFSLLDNMLPAFGMWRKDKDLTVIPEDTVVTLCCSDQVAAPVTSLGKVDVGLPMFEHEMYLVRSYTLAGTNISLLRTTDAMLNNKDMVELASGRFDNVILLDFVPWRTETFRRYYTGLKTVAFSVALVDRISKVASTEARTRKAEIKAVNKAYYNEDRVHSRRINRCFDYHDFAILASVVNPLCTAQEDAIKEQLKSMAYHFDRDSTWSLFWDMIGRQEIQLCPEIKVDDVIIIVQKVLTIVLKNEELGTFESLFTDWRYHLMTALRPIFKAKGQCHVNTDRINKTVSIYFADSIKTQINNFIK